MKVIDKAIAKVQARSDVRCLYSKIDQESLELDTPASDDAMIRYLKDSLEWLDSLDV